LGSAASSLIHATIKPYLDSHCAHQRRNLKEIQESCPGERRINRGAFYYESIGTVY
jgi:hypothetical protein